MDLDGEPYLAAPCSYLIGMVGLNELVRVHLGQELHDSEAAIKFGLKVIAHMNIVCNKLAEIHGHEVCPGADPGRVHRLPLCQAGSGPFQHRGGEGCPGQPGKGEVYYTNSTLFNVGATMSPIARVEKEGLFHPLIEAGSITHIWLGEAQPAKESLANFVINVFKYTQNDQIAFSPEFTACLDCGKTSGGLSEACPYCESKNVDGITRITGYFTKISSWNKGKLGELHDRYRNIDRFNN